MKLVRALSATAVALTLTIIACVGDEPATSSSSSGGSGACTDAQKSCNGTCVSKEDPNAGCASPDCTPCPAVTNGAPACKAGACSFACNAGSSDCDGNPANGCESNTATDLANCGACGKKCGTTNTDAATKCEAGKCVFACKQGFGHCGTSDDTGCETDLTTSAENCGACGHSCLGGKCTAGKCEPFRVLDMASPHGVAVDQKHVYVSSIADSSVVRVGHDGKCGAAAACPEVFAATSVGDTFAKVRGAAAIATDGTNVYWVAQASGTISMKPVTGGAITNTWGGANGGEPGMLALGGGKVFWTSAFGTTDPAPHAQRANADGSGIVSLSTYKVPVSTFKGMGGIAVDGTNAYWVTETTGVFRAPMNAATACVEGTSCASGYIGGSSSSYGIAVDATNIYWTEPAAGEIRRAPKGGGNVSLVAKTQDSPQSIAVMDGYVYWANTGTGAVTGGTIRRAPANGSACDAAGCEQVAVAAVPSAVIAAEDGVYWVDDEAVGGGVWRLAK